MAHRYLAALRESGTNGCRRTACLRRDEATRTIKSLGDDTVRPAGPADSDAGARGGSHLHVASGKTIRTETTRLPVGGYAAQARESRPQKVRDQRYEMERSSTMVVR